MQLRAGSCAAASHASTANTPAGLACMGSGEDRNWIERQSLAHLRRDVSRGNNLPLVIERQAPAVKIRSGWQALAA
jgi:hypothetical protein